MTRALIKPASPVVTLGVGERVYLQDVCLVFDSIKAILLIFFSFYRSHVCSMTELWHVDSYILRLTPPFVNLTSQSMSFLSGEYISSTSNLYFLVNPGNQSHFAAGLWQPAKTELAMLRFVNSTM